MYQLGMPTCLMQHTSAQVEGIEDRHRCELSVVNMEIAGLNTTAVGKGYW
jgi:hypothetical protein